MPNRGREWIAPSWCVVILDPEASTQQRLDMSEVMFALGARGPMRGLWLVPRSKRRKLIEAVETTREGDNKCLVFTIGGALYAEGDFHPDFDRLFEFLQSTADLRARRPKARARSRSAKPG